MPSCLACTCERLQRTELKANPFISIPQILSLLSYVSYCALLPHHQLRQFSFLTPLMPPCWIEPSWLEPGYLECRRASKVLIGLNSVCPSTVHTSNLLADNFLDSSTNKIGNKEMWHSTGPPVLPAGDTPGPALSSNRITCNWQPRSLRHCHQVPGFVHCSDGWNSNLKF